MNNDDDKIDIKFNNNAQTNVEVDNSNNQTNERKKPTAGRIIASIVVALVGFLVSYFFVFKKENGTLVCTAKADGYDVEFTIKIENKRYSSGKVRYTYYLNDIAKLYNMSIDELDLNNVCSRVTQTIDFTFSYNNCKEKRKGDLYYVDVDLDYYSYKEIGEVKEIKDSLEKEGYTCK